MIESDVSPRRRILIGIDWFYPAYKAGGPTRSVINLVEWLGNEFDLYVLTGDRDLGDTQPFPDVPVNTWVNYKNLARVMYLSPDRRRLQHFRAILEEVQPQVVHLNSMYSWAFTWKIRLAARLIPTQPKVYLAPRGMLRVSALAYKPLKKRVFLRMIQVLGWVRDLRFNPTDEAEAADVRRTFGPKTPIYISAQLPTRASGNPTAPEKKRGSLKLVFVARILPLKNLRLVLTALQQVKTTVQLTVIGPEEDPAYSAEMKSLAETLPDHVLVSFLGAVPPAEVYRTLCENHVFILPTEGENFGHSIFEALQAGLPAIIADTTPWRGLKESKAGFDLPLSGPDAFAEAIDFFGEMDGDTFKTWREGARSFAAESVLKSNQVARVRELFSH